MIEARTQEHHDLIGCIPVRNLWVLALYASDLARFHGHFDAEIEASPDLPELIGRLLCHAVETRLRRNLSFGYRGEKAVLCRVRSRIDILDTYAHDYLRQGKVACRFEALTIDTTRNRLVRVALDALANRVSDAALKHRCRGLAGTLGFLGVSGTRPSRSEVAQDQIGRHEAGDRFMIALARFVFDLVLPSEQEGATPLTKIERDAAVVRRLFERAVANFLAIDLAPNPDWKVSPGKWLYWRKEFETPGIAAVLPQMKTDIILQNTVEKRRIVIDTKFTGIFTSSKYREEVLRSGYIYQMYAYLRSQAGFGDALCDDAEGVLLHPAIGADVDESVRIQGHEIRFMTVDLTLPTAAILQRLRTLSNPRPG
jgi:5-methylcytosine-specific restriction enzyme subunit McrC